MSARDNSGPAFPAPDASWEHFGNKVGYTGMTVRDHFAGLAMQALIAKAPFIEDVDTQEEADEISQNVAISAYEYADAMLQERAK